MSPIRGRGANTLPLTKCNEYSACPKNPNLSKPFLSPPITGSIKIFVKRRKKSTFFLFLSPIMA